MFEGLRSAFREAVDNFRTELNRDAVPDAADRLLRAMKKELVEARLRLDELEDQLSRTRAERTTEDEAIRTCLRREEMARKIEDSETAEVARTFARRHLQRRDLLEEKEAVLAREFTQARSDLSEMEARFAEARTRKEALVAQAGRTDAHDRLAEAEALFGELDRMADRIDTFGHRVDARQEVDDHLAGEEGSRKPRGGGASGHSDLDARLAELKLRVDAQDR